MRGLNLVRQLLLINTYDQEYIGFQNRIEYDYGWYGKKGENMKKAKWLELLKKAIDYKHKSEKYLDDAVQLLAKEKGFTREESMLFEANFASGEETVVRYDGEGEFSDLDITIMSGMTKEEIIKRLEL